MTSDWRTKYIWIQYILLLLWHLLASLLPPFICPTKLQSYRMIPDLWLGHCTDCCVVCFYFTWTQPIKIKVSFSFAHDDGTYGEEHQLFLIVASDGGEWSDLLWCNHFSIRQRTPGTIEYEAGLAPEPVWMFVEVKNHLNLWGIWPGSS